jgi:hypothetical protein
VGAGASVLADELIAAGWQDVTLLDISSRALAEVRARLHGCAGVSYVETDLLAWDPPRELGAWHDRAVFHFLTGPQDQRRYVDLACRTVAHGGVAVLGTFAEDGPASCSGLPTARYSADGLAALFAPAFVLEYAEAEQHATPSGATQSFTWVVLRRL